MIDRVMGEPISILLVEDNLADVRLIRDILKDFKVTNTVQVVGDGEEALTYLRRQDRYADAPRPDLILLDLNLPRKDGREVLGEIKSDPALQSIPVVVLTSSSAESDIAQAYNLHANCYITKPVDLDQFISIISAIDEFWLTVVKLPGRPA